jgi:hypothetical protein
MHRNVDFNKTFFIDPPGLCRSSQVRPMGGFGQTFTSSSDFVLQAYHFH